MSEYLTRIIRDFNDDELRTIVADGIRAAERTDLTPAMIALRETWGLAASKEQARRTEFRRFERQAQAQIATQL